MWIETEVKGTFTTKKGDTMVSFTATRDDGRNWAAPLKVVSKGIAGDISIGLAVRLDVSGEFIKSVQKNRRQPANLQRPLPGDVTNTTIAVLPYGFVPIDLNQAITETPVLHDGSSGGDLLSGEILCELEALTPLLPGNARYAVSDAKTTWGFKDLDKDKQIAEPLRLPDGRVVIAGSALKGMIRQSLGALASAPMERVDQTNLKPDQRHVCLKPLDNAPARLTSARLLFGYVRNEKSDPVSQGAVQRLAGRIAINHAVSVSIPDFLGNLKDYCVPLKILAQPKPAAMKLYLQQIQDFQEPPSIRGDQIGRKFYLHQKDTCQSDIAASSPNAIKSKQATLARFICQPGTRFRFAIRFARLREWELGALLAVLEPDRLALDDKTKHYAHKLGLGRPLGMGSVSITCQALRIRLEKETVFLDDAARDQKLDNALQTLRTKVNDNLVRQWLAVHEVVDGQRLAYRSTRPGL